MSRTFDSAPARRVGLPLMVSATGASGSGKTKSALRMADGIARVTPGPIVVIDTEAMRATMHADAHKFIHVPFSPPFSPLDYVDAIKHALTYNPSTIIIDSMSHEHEGEGGVLAQHAAVVESKGQSHSMAAWIKPKAQHREMKNFILQQRVHWIFCFRAKEKTVPGEGKGDKPIDLGWCALGAEDLIYEMLINVLLFPGADGVPTWSSQRIGERALMKLPGWFRDLFAKPRQLDEDIGERLARWAKGDEPNASPVANHIVLVDRFNACTTHNTFEAAEREQRVVWDGLGRDDRAAVAKAKAAARERLEEARQVANNS